MVEIAISLAIIGIALVSIIGVLPIGLHTQRDNREETLINQDATVFLEAIRGGARGMDDLTNYVFAITNNWGQYNSSGVLVGTNVSGYNYTHSALNGAPMTPEIPITNGFRIVGLLSTPEYTDTNGLPLPNLLNGGYSNHVVAYVRSLSGPAVEKPPQDSGSIIASDSFGYRILCVNAPVTMFTPPLWSSSQLYNQGDSVSYLLPGQTTYSYWQATLNTGAGDIPGLSPLWKRIFYPQELGANLHELRLSFLWPLLPNNNLPGDFKRQTFRALIAGQLATTNLVSGQFLYFFQPGTFAATP